MSRHYLYEIDLDSKTAFCTSCGYTEIHAPKSRTQSPPKVFCISRYQENLEANRNRKSEDRSLQPDLEPRHSLSEIDAEKRTAFCSVCGRTDIQRRSVRGSVYYSCAQKARSYQRKYRRSYYVPRTSKLTVHTLSQIDEENETAVCSKCGPVEIYVWQAKRKVGRRCSNANVDYVLPAKKIRREINTKLIYQYKADHGCQRCGENKNLLKLFLYSQDQNKKELKMEKLLKLSREQLMRTFENSEVLCLNCHSPKPPHHLENVDLEQRNAICSVCGTTQIVILKNRKYPHWAPSIYCINKARETNRMSQRRLRAQRRVQDPSWKPMHKVSEIDLDTMTGVCSVCGPTEIRKRMVDDQKYTAYLCATKLRADARLFRLSHSKSSSET
jgi:hypothetical protein